MPIAIPSQTLTVRFAYAIELVLRGFSLSLPRTSEVAPLAIGTWNRLKRLVARFSALVAAVEAGRLRTTRRTPVAKRRTGRLLPENESGAPGRARMSAPTAYGWLLTLAPALDTRIGRAQIETLLGDPALLALLARAPQAGRVLRPLCHMLRIERPECLKLAPRPRRPATSDGAPKAASAARPNRPPKPPWLRWPKSPALPGMPSRSGPKPRRRAGTGPPGD